MRPSMRPSLGAQKKGEWIDVGDMHSTRIPTLTCRSVADYAPHFDQFPMKTKETLDDYQY